MSMDDIAVGLSYKELANLESEYREQVNELLVLFDRVLNLAMQQLEWFGDNNLFEGDVDYLNELAVQRQEIMQEIDEKLCTLKDAGFTGSGELTPIAQRIMSIDNLLQEKALAWMQDLKGKMQQGKAARQANEAYGKGSPVPGAAFFDGKR